MNTDDIILTIDAEIPRLQQANALLTQASNRTPAKTQTWARDHWILGVGNAY